MKPHYTRKVMDAAALVREMTAGELLALRETLAGYFDMGPDAAGVREPRSPSPKGGSGSIKKEVSDG